jgi:hypothetical protein
VASNRPDFGGDFDFEELLRAGQDKLEQPLHTGRRAPIGGEGIPSKPAAQSQGSASYRPLRRARGQGTSWIAIVLVVLAGATAGFGAYRCLDAITLALLPFEQARPWATVVVIGLSIGVAALVVAVIAVFRARPKTVAVMALMLGVLLPPLAFTIGVRFGFAAFTKHMERAVRESGTDVVQILTQLLEASGIDPTPYIALIRILLG